ncbi:MAG: hypothetical protein HeimC3_26030 [Candidatus Heimdallarchaeota archaeon LC_3]|nr:MAG: hypothetical protein HeimC3_26030 [Candidatus Heimdallarchaeota archaeon LC_3]
MHYDLFYVGGVFKNPFYDPEVSRQGICASSNPDKYIKGFKNLYGYSKQLFTLDKLKNLYINKINVINFHINSGNCPTILDVELDW